MGNLRRHAWSARLFAVCLALAVVALTIALVPATASADTDLAVGGTGVVAYANGDSVRLRTAPGYGSDTVDYIPEGTSVSVDNGVFWADDGSSWYQITVWGETGYMDSTYLASSGALYTNTSGNAVTNDSVNLRSGPSTADGVIVELPAGASITLTGDNIDGWLSVGYNGNYGYVYGAFVGDGSAAPAPAPAASDSSSSDTSSSSSASGSNVSWDGSTGTRYTSDSLNLRSGAGTDQGVISVLAPGTAVSLTGGWTGNWVQVSTDSGTGWVSADYLTETAPAAPAADTSSSQAAPAASSGGDSEGQQIVNYAMQFLGYPYVWAAEDPAVGFDCSGLTQYVLLNTIGVDIGHSSYDQPNYGTPVDMSNLAPGDLVFFANTDGPGVTHVGIYIGGGQFIHAENPSTGVVISDLNSDYYSSHYYGATRVR